MTSTFRTNNAKVVTVNISLTSVQFSGKRSFHIFAFKVIELFYIQLFFSEFSRE